MKTDLPMVSRLALRELDRNRMRSLLTALGIIIGVACVVAMIGIGSGASQNIQQMVNSLGSNFIVVLPGTSTSGGARIWSAQSTLTPGDAEAVRSECPSVSYVSPNVTAHVQIVAGETNWGTHAQGVGAEWPFVRGWNTVEGTFFSDQDVRSGAKVCVLGATVAETLFGGASPVGQTVRIARIPFRVVGLLDRKGAIMGGDQDDVVIVPYTTAMQRLTGKAPRLGAIFVSAASAGKLRSAVEEIETLLSQRHHIPPSQDLDFTIRTQEEFSQIARESTRTLSILLGSAAAIAMLVGGIGIMNIMLVSVTERTHEIGLRRAVGARARQVMVQFLTEALTLSVAGGLIGVAVGVGAAKLIALHGEFAVRVGPGAIFTAFGFAVAVGVLFGLYPARRAARLDPVEAMRRE